MVVRKKTKDLSPEEIEQLYNINLARCLNDYGNVDSELFDFHNITLISFYEYRYHDFDVIMGEDWYLLFMKKDYRIKIDQFYAMPNLNPKRTAEIIATLRELLKEFKGYLCIATMRHDTSYKLFLKLERYGYIENIHVKTIPEVNDTTGSNIIIEELEKNGTLKNKDHYKCLQHNVIFRIGKISDLDNPLLEEKQDMYIYTLSNRR